MSDTDYDLRIALNRYSVFFAAEQALSEAVGDNGKVIDMHLPVLEFERERIGVSLHRDKIGNIEALLLAEHSRIDIYPLARRHDLLVELAKHRRGTEKHTSQTPESQRRTFRLRALRHRQWRLQYRQPCRRRKDIFGICTAYLASPGSRTIRTIKYISRAAETTAATRA